ncbi:MAG: ATP-binding protein, partial [Chloroflexi bacterium]|nr:ATP-binding protein [Chloroflexota bacterium]
IKFTPAGGEIWVKSWLDGDSLHFEVEDTGVGVPADKLDGLWEAFTQMADPLRRGKEGLGLGLALVKFVVGAHGGEVCARSEAGQGSTFGFHVPLNGV